MATPDINNAVILVDKPAGITSSQLVQQIRKTLKIKKLGHSGTLDRFASGLMVLCSGRYTRLTRFFLDEDKRYQGTIQLGIETDTCDPEGAEVSRGSYSHITRSEIEKALQELTGELDQLPPLYSALKIQGSRASDRMRNGEQVDLKTRKILVHSLTCSGYDAESGQVHINVYCSKGTYVRSLARDLGIILGCGAYLSSLRRTGTSGFDIEQACELDKLNSGSCTSGILMPADALSNLGVIELNQEGARLVSHGAFFEKEQVTRQQGESGMFRITGTGDKLVAVAQVDIMQWTINYLAVFNG